MENPNLVKILPEFTNLDAENTNNYFKAKRGIDLLEHYIINPFESQLKKETHYDNENLPRKKIDSEFDLGKYHFKVCNEIRQKKPKSSEIFKNITDYFKFLERDYNEGIKRKNVFTMDETPYTTLDNLIQKISEFKEEVSEENIKQTITYSHEGEEEFSHGVMLPDEPYNQLNEYGAILYTDSKHILNDLKKKIVKPFQDKLKEQIPYNKDNLPNKLKKIQMNIEGNRFELSANTINNPSYAKIFNALTKEGKRVTKTTGELILLRDGFDLDEKIKEFYQPIIKSGTTYVSIPGISERMKDLKQEYIKPSLKIGLKGFERLD